MPPGGAAAHLTSPAVRRVGLPLVLAVVAVVAAVLAVRAEAEPDAAGGRPEAVAHLATPVLSVRRVPDFLVDPVADTALQLSLLSFLQSAPPSTCLVVERTGGPRLVSHQPDLPLIPASTQKLLTAAAVLDVLDPASTLTTRAVAAAPPQGGVVAGDQWQVGGGDPLLATPDYVTRFEIQPWPRTAVEQLADRIAESVTRVDGRVVGDDSRYDALRSVPTWPERYLGSGDVGSLSAVAVNDGYEVYPAPSADPARSAAAILTELLEQRGVTVAGEPASGPAPAGAAEVATLPSLPLGEVVAHMVRDSDNESAELLVKELGREVAGSGTTAAGVQAATATLADAGVAMAGTTLTDGSGLDRGNRVTCATLVSLLEEEGPDSPVTSALPVAAEDGTLTERFAGSPAAGVLRGKTGTLLGVTGLTGFVDTPAGGHLTFAFLSNGEFDQEGGYALFEQLGALLAAFPQGPSPDEVAPLPPT